MTGLKSAFAAIHRSNAEPELKFAAAMIAAAAEAAREGDALAYRWIGSPCSLRWLVAIVPANDSCERIRDQLLQTVPEPADFRDVAIFQPSETAGYWQSSLPGLEQEAPNGNDDDLLTLRTRVPDPTRGHPQRRVAQPALPSV